MTEQMKNKTTEINQTQELKPIIWCDETQEVNLIDQRLLPYELKYLSIKNHSEMAAAIKDMVLRGAPLIGISAAYGMVLAVRNLNEELKETERSSYEIFDFILAELQKADHELRSTRPTAVNLMWALDICRKTISSFFNSYLEDNGFEEGHKINVNDVLHSLYEELLELAHWILEDDIKRCKAMGDFGAEYIKEKFKDKISKGKKLKIMTHCNAGALATGGYGTALGVIRSLHRDGLVEMVYSDETRPRQQGSRLSVWELAYDQIPVTMNTDNMSAHLMKQGLIDLVVTGSDRITANGDAANKIGTYQLAIAANYHKIPFYVAAPMSTVDKSLAHGDLIPIEERSYEEVSHINSKACTFIKSAEDTNFGEVKFVNPGFDVTPNELIEAIFTEEGLFQ